ADCPRSLRKHRKQFICGTSRDVARTQRFCCQRSGFLEACEPGGTEARSQTERKPFKEKALTSELLTWGAGNLSAFWAFARGCDRVMHLQFRAGELGVSLVQVRAKRFEDSRSMRRTEWGRSRSFLIVSVVCWISARSSFFARLRAKRDRSRGTVAYSSRSLARWARVRRSSFCTALRAGFGTERWGSSGSTL